MEILEIYLCYFFFAGANFWAILGHFWAILAIWGHFRAILSHFGSFLGHFLVLIFFGQKFISAIFITFCISEVMPFSPQLIYNYTFLCCTLVFRDFFCKRFSKKSFIGDKNFTFFSYCVLLRELANVLQVTLHLALLAGAKISVEH